MSGYVKCFFKILKKIFFFSGRDSTEMHIFNKIEAVFPHKNQFSGCSGGQSPKATAVQLSG
jgi:hypothetical protein